MGGEGGREGGGGRGEGERDDCYARGTSPTGYDALRRNS